MSTDLLAEDVTEGGDVYLTAKQVRRRYGGKSDMWLWRLLHGDANFPRPFIIRKMRYWRLSELLGWEEPKRRG